MSILIKGMTMPTRCYFCPCADLEYYDCNLMPGTEIAAHGRLPDCPLVELPPHGDLIDRYDLKNKKITIDFDKWDDTFEDGLLFVADLIDNAPTIIEAEGEE